MGFPVWFGISGLGEVLLVLTYAVVEPLKDLHGGHFSTGLGGLESKGICGVGSCRRALPTFG